MYNYKIKIACTTKDDLCYNNKKISNKNYNRPNFEELINNTDYIETALILYKNSKTNKNEFIITKSLEFMCKYDNEISELNFQKFIKSLKKIGFSSGEFNTIHLIKINNNEQEEKEKLILKYKFQSETKTKIKNKKKKKNKSSYSTQFLYKNTR